MVWHVVCFRWKEGATPEQVDEVAAAPRELPGLIPEIRSLKCGPDMDVSAGTGTSRWSRVITELIAPIRADRAAVHFDAG